MVVPGFVANDRTTLGLQRALAAAGYRVTGWGLGMNRGATPDMLERLAGRIEAFGGGGQDRPGRLEPRRRLRARGRQAAARSGREGGDARLAFLRRSARQQCLAALRMDRRPQGRRSADQDRPRRKAAGADARLAGRGATASSRSPAPAACRTKATAQLGARLQPYGLRRQRPRLSRRSSRLCGHSKSSPGRGRSGWAASSSPRSLRGSDRPDLGPRREAAWWRGPAVTWLKLRAPSTMLRMVPLPVPGRI